MNGVMDVCGTAAELVTTAADRIAERLHDAVRVAGSASLVLSGGSTPRNIYRALTAPVYQKRFSWNNVHFFWGDERHVPPFSPESNFRMANEALLKPAGIAERNIHRIRAELPAAAAAAAYEQEIQNLFSLKEGDLPEFDVMLLGLGDDGHTASLFPGTAALTEDRRLVVANTVTQLSTERITMTFPVINAARYVMILVAGTAKAAILHNVAETSMPYPVRRLAPAGDLIWLVDRDAASLLTKTTRT